MRKFGNLQDIEAHIINRSIESHASNRVKKNSAIYPSFYSTKIRDRMGRLSPYLHRRRYSFDAYPTTNADSTLGVLSTDASSATSTIASQSIGCGYVLHRRANDRNGNSCHSILQLFVTRHYSVDKYTTECKPGSIGRQIIQNTELPAQTNRMNNIITITGSIYHHSMNIMSTV